MCNSSLICLRGVSGEALLLSAQQSCAVHHVRYACVRR